MSKIIVSKEEGEFNAQVTKGFLESNGISASVSVNQVSRYGGAGRTFAVYVEEVDGERAGALLKEREEPQDEK